eukprot:COSAG03_NODE_1792_length_3518_cov_11.157063_4_plen_82_part_00
MTITRHGKTVKCFAKKASYTFLWVLDAGWTCGGKLFGCTPGHHAALAMSICGTKKYVREVPNKEDEKQARKSSRLAIKGAE